MQALETQRSGRTSSLGRGHPLHGSHRRVRSLWHPVLPRLLARALPFEYCFVDVLTMRTSHTVDSPPDSAFPASRSDALKVAVGFSPRKNASLARRRVATLEATRVLTHASLRDATEFPPQFRGLKPTATFTPSLRDGRSAHFRSTGASGGPKARPVKAWAEASNASGGPGPSPRDVRPACKAGTRPAPSGRPRCLRRCSPGARRGAPHPRLSHRGLSARSPALPPIPLHISR